MKRLGTIVLCCVCLFVFSGSCYAGVLNSPKSIGDLIEKLEPKAGGTWLKRPFKENDVGAWEESIHGALYTFKARPKVIEGVEIPEEAIRVGSIDLGYADERKILLSTFLDIKILDVLDIKLPFGNIDIMAGGTIGYDWKDGMDFDSDKIVAGISVIGKFSFKFD